MQPTNNNKTIIIRFSKFGNKYRLGQLGSYHDKSAITKAIQICIAIETDIKLGRFTATNNAELFKAYHPLASLSSHHASNSYSRDAITMIECHLSKLEFKDKVLTPCLTLLKAYGKPVQTKDQAVKFWDWMQTQGNRNNNSNNLYLATLKPVCPMFQGIKPLKSVAISKDEKPFTKNEIKAIISTVDTHFPHYSSFIKFLFSTGCRPNEATALTWDCVDFEAKTITIKKALAIAKDGTKRTKKTKTGIDRVIPISNQVYILLKYQASAYADHAFTDLVFPSSKLTYIDLGNFRSRVWTKALQLANIQYRTVYNTRHTFCSHFLNETPDFVKLCSITHGSKSGIATLQKHYAHIVDKPVMPEMF